MNDTHKRLWLLAIPLTMTICCLTFWYLPKIGGSSGIPSGSCSVNALLLDISAFPANTTMSYDEDFEDLASDTASRTFRNQLDRFEVYHAVEYYNTSLLAWQTYKYNYRIFKQNENNDTWVIPDEITFSSQIADQYHFACSDNTDFGYRCMLTARYGRYFVFFRANLSQEFGIDDVQSMLQKIDKRMSLCIHN